MDADRPVCPGVVSPEVFSAKPRKDHAMLRTGQGASRNRCATAASSISAARRSTTSPAIRPSATPPQTVAAHLRHEGRSGQPRRHDLRGGRRPPLDLFPARRKTRDDLQRRMVGHRSDRRSHLRHVRPLARSRRVLRHRHGDEARRADRAARPRRQSAATTTTTSATTISTWSMPWCRRRPRAIRNSTRSRTSRCRPCAWCARTTTASSFPA